ncbi:polyprenyl synthetase family protein [Actinokineospora sp. G85]|uniref:polyprenyl synthetase family protein n=1 Tax=Actinokineospora sp. G85 TaxID=3406626 RepID=UPI003C7681D9
MEPHLSAYGRAVGLAFQHRDDLLDVFGDERETGKPVAGDIAHQKATRLLSALRRRATGADLAVLDGAVDLAELRSVLVGSGAVDELESLIDDLTAAAVAAATAAPITEPSRRALIDAAHFAAVRRW